MNPILDIFNNDAFSLASLTAGANEQPVAPSQISDSGLFAEEGVTTTTIAFENQRGTLSMVEPTPRGGPGEAGGRDPGSNLVPFIIPHLERNDAVLADQVQNVREFGSTDQVKSVRKVIDGRIATHTTALDFTIEHHRLGAIQGIVLSKSGAVIANLYTAFNITEAAEVSLGLDNDATVVRKECEKLRIAVEDDLDAPYTKMHTFVDNEFWLKLTNHKSVRESWIAASKIAEAQGKTPDTFEIGGIVFERYRMGKGARTANGGNGFIGANKGRLVPFGVPGLFVTKFAPADYVETVNTIGLPRYAKQYVMANGKGVHLDVQSNPLSICTRPSVLRKIAA